MSVPASEFDERFVEYMRNRMEVYGPVKEAFPHKVDAIASLLLRIDKYNETGNTEWLVDAANFAMIEFMHPGHKNAEFHGTDSSESPGRVWHDHKNKARKNDGERV